LLLLNSYLLKPLLLKSFKFSPFLFHSYLLKSFTFSPFFFLSSFSYDLLGHFYSSYYSCFCSLTLYLLTLSAIIII